jgi:ketopantoate reductase
MNEELKSIHPRRKKCCGGLFADDVVLIAPSAKNLEKLLKKVHRWANLNEMVLFTYMYFF